MLRAVGSLACLILVACAVPADRGTEESGGGTGLVWPAPPAAARIAYVQQFSSAGDLGLTEGLASRFRDWLAGPREQSLVRPYAIAVSDGLIAVADPGAAVVHLYDTDGGRHRAVEDVGGTQLVSPVGVALSKERLFIADSGLNLVFITTLTGDRVGEVPGLGRPTGLSYDRATNRLIVADTTNHVIQIYGADGKWVGSIGRRGESEGQFNYPTHVSSAEGRIYVNDTMNFRIQVFDSNGQLLRIIGQHGVGSGLLTQPKGVAADAEGNIYVADAISDQIQIFSQSGAFLLGFGSTGNGPGNFRMPAGLAIDGDRIFVADSHNGRIQQFRYLGERP